MLYALLPASLALSYPGFVAVFLLAQIAGVISNIPGGLGVFETVILLLLGSMISVPGLLGSLIAYRCIYYMAPLILAVGLLAIFELRQKLRGSNG